MEAYDGEDVPMRELGATADVVAPVADMAAPVPGKLDAVNLKQLRLYLKATGSEIKARPLNYCLGACACFIVVLVIAVLIAVLAQAPVLFMRLSELQTGEVDVLLEERDRRLNFTLAMQQAVGAGGAPYSYGSPRLALNGSHVVLRRCLQYDTVSAWDVKVWPYLGDPGVAVDPCSTATNADACFAGYCLGSRLAPVPSVTLAINQTAEARAGVGRAWQRNGFNSTGGIPAGACFLNSNLAGQLNAAAGDLVVLTFTLEEMLGPLWRSVSRGLQRVPNSAAARANSSALPSYVYVATHTTVYVTLRVQGIYSGGGGKHPSDIQVAVVDSAGWYGVVADNAHPLLNPTIVARLRALPLAEYATQVVWNLPPLRVDAYRSTDQTAIESAVSGFASRLLYLVGFFNVPSSLPVLVGVKSYRFFSLFLGLILNIIILFVFFLSVMLIYSLLMVSVEARTFELGIMRMVGMSRPRVVGLVLTQALAFAVPAIGLGLPVAQLVAVGLTNFLQNLSLVELSPLLTPLSICLAILAGLLVPILSAIVPIRAALSKNIWDSVDTKRSKTKAVEIKLTRQSSSRPSLTYLIVGLAMFGFGFVIYYVLPLALVSSNVYLLLNLFFLVLMAMLFGLVVLASNVEPALEWLFMWGLFFWERAAVRTVALRNFDAHRRRNSKTALMFAISLAFLIFLSVTFGAQLSSLSTREQQRRATTISVRLSRFNYRTEQAPGPGIPVAAIEKFAATQPLILDYAFVTMPIEWQVQSVVGAAVLNMGHLNSFGQNVRGVSPSVFTSSFSGFTVLGAQDPLAGATRPRETVPYRLYYRNGSSAVLMGTNLAGKMGIDRSATRGASDVLLQQVVSEPTPLTVSSVAGSGASVSSRATTTTTTLTHLDVASFLSLAPLFTFSLYPSGSSQDVLLSLPAFARLCAAGPNSTVTSVDALRMEYALFQTSARVTNAQYDALKRDLTRALADTGVANLDVYDTRDVTASLATATSLINFFFLFTVVVALVICFFSLVSSMYTNIFEQKKEIGVMIALGISKSWLYRMYMWEGIVVVLSSSMLGIGIGVLVSWTVTLQQTLFTQLPVAYEFPWVITVGVIVLSFLFGLLAAAIPLRAMLRHSPVEILRSA